MTTVLSKEVFDFLKALEKNNYREWFTDNKPKFKEIELDVKDFYNQLNNALQKIDDIDTFKLFRIYRDVRFSKDKTPYKTHFGGSFHRKKPHLRGGYYLHIAPGDSFIATGFWGPSKEDLLRIRKELELDAAPFRKIIERKEFKAVWGDLEGDEVKTSPKGFHKEHESIDLIKKKQYIFTRKYTDKQVMSPDFLDDVSSSFKAIRPYFNFMSEVLTTDLNGVSLIA